MKSEGHFKWFKLAKRFSAVEAKRAEVWRTQGNGDGNERNDPVGRCLLCKSFSGP